MKQTNLAEAVNNNTNNALASEDELNAVGTMLEKNGKKQFWQCCGCSTIIVAIGIALMLSTTNLQRVVELIYGR